MEIQTAQHLWKPSSKYTIFQHGDSRGSAFTKGNPVLEVLFQERCSKRSTTRSSSIICISPISEEKRGHCGNRSSEAREAELCNYGRSYRHADLGRGTQEIKCSHVLRYIAAWGWGSEDTHSARAESNYPNAFCWLFGELMGGNYTGSITGDWNSQRRARHVSASLTQQGTCSRPSSPIRSGFLEDTRMGISCP